MAAPRDTAESAEPPASATRGAEIAPLVEAEPSPAELLRKAHEEIEDAEARLQRWEEGVGATAAARAPFDLTIQPVVSGDDAAIELSRVTASMPVSELLDLIHAEKPEATPDRQRLFIAKGAQEPLADETLPIGAYGVVEGVALHLAMRDEKAAAARRELRAKLREELREERERREREQREQREADARAAPRRKAICWLMLLGGGVAVQQFGWWSLYSDLGLWCALLGGAVVLAGALGFDCGVAGHSEDWRPCDFWCCLFGYAVFGAIATVLSAAFCPALGTDDSSTAGTDEGWDGFGEAPSLRPGAEGEGWVGRAGGNCGAPVCAGALLFTLLFLFFLLINVCLALGAMGQADDDEEP
eukprot:COSAG04_NODE_330_length_16594_cov_25.794146_1_plen_359_part_00